VIRNYKTKEKAVVDAIQNRFDGFTWVWDKRIQNGCSKRRPDLLLDLGSHILLVEIDEQAHSDYNCSCENLRLQLISQDLGFRPIILLRFNPDSYESIDGERITSCWTTNKLGIVCIAKRKVKEWNERLQVLFEMIEYWIQHVPKYEFELGKDQNIILEIVELFFSV
jgi:hypothetical protein